MSELIETRQPDDDPALRPKTFAEFVGQDPVRDLLQISVSSAKARKELSIDHVILYGPPGLGKTTLANILALEFGTRAHILSSPAIQRVGDLAAVMVSMGEGDVLFLDEIHRLPAVVCELIYGAMEDFRLDILAGAGNSTQIVHIPLPRFTLLGATTKPGQIPRPLRDRFGIDVSLQLYGVADLTFIVERSARLLKVNIPRDVATLVAQRSRGTPRVANRLLRRLRDYALHDLGKTVEIDDFAFDCMEIEKSVAEDAFNFLGIDEHGLTSRDRKYLSCVQSFHRPVGIKTISSILGEDVTSIEEDIEPWLIRQKFIEKSPSGRITGPNFDLIFNALNL